MDKENEDGICPEAASGLAGNDEDDQPLPAPESPASSSSNATTSKKRKRTKDEKMEAIFTGVVKEMVEAQRESDKMFAELEEKRMKHEANQKKNASFN